MSRHRFPHPLALLLGCVLLAAILTHFLPAGSYERRDEKATGRRVVVAGTYHPVESHPLGAFEMLVALPKGMADAGPVIFFVFLVGGALTVVDRTGAFAMAVEGLARRLGGSPTLVVPAVCVLFALGGALDNMREEIIALVPVLLVLTRRFGLDPLCAAAMSIGSAAVGSAFSPINPFQVGIAQKLAQLPLLSGWGFRLVFLACALGVWAWGTARYAAGCRVAQPPAPPAEAAPGGRRQGLILILVLLTFALFVYGVLRYEWEFDQMSALFFAMGVAAGMAGGLGVEGTASAFVEGFRSMAYAALLIGFARAIYVVLEQGRIVDTIVNALFAPLAHLPLLLCALGMMVVQAAIHVPVPSVSGQAVLTMPILVALSDLLGLSRQVTVLAYHYGAGLSDLLTPTNGALMAILAAAGVRYEKWLRFAAPLVLALFALAMAAIAAGVLLGLR